MRAMQLQVFQYLKDMITAFHAEDVSEANLTGYKSVLKGLISILLSAFSVSALPDNSLLVEVYCMLLHSQSALCHQFWEEDFRSSALRSLLDTARVRFPLIQFNELIQILTALSSGMLSPF